MIVVGVTHNSDEAYLARAFVSSIHVIDIERDFDCELGGPFDLLLFSHVLEHTRDPLSVIRRFLPLLSPEGHVLIAVPNTLEWRTRLCFARGHFHYAESGILDRTHLRHFTYKTASHELIAPLLELTLVNRKGRGSLPFGRLRRAMLPSVVNSFLNNLALKLFPNLVASEVALLARRRTT